jgi:hypothetical protein
MYVLQHNADAAEDERLAAECPTTHAHSTDEDSTASAGDKLLLMRPEMNVLCGHR